MSIYIQKQDELFINTEGLAGTNTKPGIFLFRSGSLRDHTTAISSSVNHIIAITCSSNVDSVLTKLSNTNAYAIITITSGSSKNQPDTRLIFRYVSASFEVSGSNVTQSIATDKKLLFKLSGSQAKNDYYLNIPIKHNDDSFSVAYKTVNALNKAGNGYLYTASLVDDGSNLLNPSSSLGENMSIGSTFKIRNSASFSASVDVTGKFILTNLRSGSVSSPDFSGTKVQVGEMKVGSTFKVGDTNNLFQSNVIQEGSGNVNQTFYKGNIIFRSSSLGIELDPNDKRSAFITGSSLSASIYFSGSGQMGVGTKNPKSAFDIKADDFKVRSRDGKREVRIQADGRLSARQFAGNTGVSESLGGVMVLSYSPGTFETPTQAQPGETVGTIIFADESLNASASIANVIGSGSVAQIKSTVRGSTPLGGGGVYGDLEFFCNLDSSTSSSMVPFFKIGPQTMFDNGYGAHFPFPVSMSRQLAIGNELASQGPTPDHALVVNGNVAITGSLEITGAVTSSIISSSIIYSSGSNIFGDEDADSHMFNGRITASSHISTSGDLFGYNITAGRDLTVSRAITCNNITTVRTTHVTASGNISASGNIINTGNITTTQITASGDISSSATITAEHIESKDDMTVAGDLDVAGEIECDHLNISDVDDGIHFGDTKVIHIDADNNVNVGVEGVSIVDLELYGHNHNYIAAGSIDLDAGSTITLDSATGYIQFQDEGTNQLTLDMDGTTGAQIFQLRVSGDDLVFKSQGGDSLLTLKSEGQTEIHSHITASGNISASGRIIGDRVYPGGYDASSLPFLSVTGGQILSSTGFSGAHITASGNISGSGTSLITAQDLTLDRQLTVPTIANVNTTHVTASGNISGSGNIETSGTIFAGWHGSTTRIKILPRDFVANDIGRPLMIEDDAVAASKLFLHSFSTGDAFAYVPIPTGYKATHVKINGSNTGQNFYVYEGNIDTLIFTDVATGTTAIGTEKTLGTEVTSDATNYILVRVTSGGSTDQIHGGYITIAPA